MYTPLFADLHTIQKDMNINMKEMTIVGCFWPLSPVSAP